MLAGVDEVGRGALAGPVLAAAVIIGGGCCQPLSATLNDSKLVNASIRLAVARKIRLQTKAWGIGWALPSEVDRVNIAQASLLAMTRALQRLRLSVQPDSDITVLIDGLHLPSQLPKGIVRTCAVVKGDQRVPEISAASILAKVVRDRLMSLYSCQPQYSAYGWEINKGYSTREHVSALAQHGVSHMHRRSFAPVRSAQLAEVLH